MIGILYAPAKVSRNGSDPASRVRSATDASKRYLPMRTPGTMRLSSET